MLYNASCRRLQVELRESEGSRQQLLRELEQSNAELALLRDTHASQKQVSHVPKDTHEA